MHNTLFKTQIALQKSELKHNQTADEKTVKHANSRIEKNRSISYLYVTKLHKEKNYTHRTHTTVIEIVYSLATYIPSEESSKQMSLPITNVS